MHAEHERKSKTHYHVTSDAPEEEGGPLEPVVLTNKRDAERQMIAIKNQYIDFNAPWECDVIEKQVNPNDLHVTSLNAVYKRLLASAQNRGMNGRVVSGSIGGIDNLGRVLFDFDPALTARKYSNGWEEVFEDIKRELRPRGKLRTATRTIWPQFCRAVIAGAQFLSQFASADEFYRWADTYYGDERTRVTLPAILDQRIPGFGPALARDFLKELGFLNYGKPDVHIKRVFASLGLRATTDDFEVIRAIERVARNVGVSPFNVDKLFWLIGSGRVYADGARIGNHEEAFIAYVEQGAGCLT